MIAGKAPKPAKRAKRPYGKNRDPDKFTLPYPMLAAWMCSSKDGPSVTLTFTLNELQALAAPMLAHITPDVMAELPLPLPGAKVALELRERLMREILELQKRRDKQI